MFRKLGSSRFSANVGFRTLIARVFALLTLLTLGSRSLIAATPEEINLAIEKGIGALLAAQKPDGTWEKSLTPPVGEAHGADGNQWGGRTALCTYALLSAGVKPLDPNIVRATDFLRKASITGYYAIGVRANVWLHLPPTPENREAATRDAKLLLMGIAKTGTNQGFYTYTGKPGSIDISCSQYGVLGAWAASEVLEPFPAGYWKLAEDNWRAEQGHDGAWGYNGKPKDIDGHGKATIQMTAAGVATLFITQEFLHADEGIEGNKGNIVDPWINKGIEWISKDFGNAAGKPSNYALYGIERVGVASGYKYFGKVDWFQKGAEFLVRAQDKRSGAWGDEIHTSFALLFLSRGRAPVMMNKLQYNITEPRSRDAKPKEANWNQRPRDVANATRWVAEKTERTLNWQIVNLEVATIQDLHDSNILYISGNQSLSFTDAEKAMLKQYIEEGGLIIGNADVGRNDFVRSFRELATDLFPQYEFTQLQPGVTHPLMSNQQFNTSAWKSKPRIEAMGNGARLFMVLIPNDDFSRTLQKRDANRQEVFEFFANAFLYANDKTQGRYKGETHVVRPNPTVKPASTIQVARLKYAGNWDPEPGGWKRLAAVMHNEDRADVQAKPIQLGKDSLDGFKIAHLTGTGQFQLTPDEERALQAFLKSGGLLIVDAAGGSPEFDAAFQRTLLKLLPDQAAQIASALPATHAIFTADAATPLEPKYRVFAQLKLAADATRFRLTGVQQNGKLAVIYSPDDLSVGLVGNQVDGVIGYTPELATTLMRRIMTLRVAGKI